ncbi:hypothetical protein HMPREF1633_05345 [Tissierellia bacterium S5-A11]|nr:hypothetical protein HMPREF1633_05345 [Tissierellia bacterium S5-A11]
MILEKIESSILNSLGYIGRLEKKNGNKILWRFKMTNLEYIVQALTNLGGKAHYYELYNEFERISGKIMTKNTKASIRFEIQRHSSDSTQFNGKKDLFYSEYGLGNGIWGLRAHKK